MADVGNRKPARRETSKTRPRHARGLTAAAKRRVPDAPECAAERHQARPVPRHSIVAGVPQQDRAQIRALLRDGLVQPPPQDEAHAKFGGIVPEVASRHHLELARRYGTSWDRLYLRAFRLPYLRLKHDLASALPAGVALRLRDLLWRRRPAEVA